MIALILLFAVAVLSIGAAFIIGRAVAKWWQSFKRP